ncbi:hypothetical protein [Streptomyces fractus]|uniref:hypothetical protein n=1 Tax=Streptomyces fractus TaxID=641806 RepID=UPI003CECAF27
MTEAEIVAIALATGAAQRLTGIGGVVAELHTVLQRAVRERLAGGEYGVRVLDAYATDPDVWQTRLLQVLADGMDMDEEVVRAARAVLRADGNSRNGLGPRPC